MLPEFLIAGISVMENQQDDDDDRDRHPKQPQQNSASHGSTP
jgi:hypothetical protein